MCTSHVLPHYTVWSNHVAVFFEIALHTCTLRVLPRAADVQHQHGRLQTVCSDNQWFILDLLLVIFMPAGEKYKAVGCVVKVEICMSLEVQIPTQPPPLGGWA